jgi:hypothetical protein
MVLTEQMGLTKQDRIPTPLCCSSSSRCRARASRFQKAACAEPSRRAAARSRTVARDRAFKANIVSPETVEKNRRIDEVYRQLFR